MNPQTAIKIYKLHKMCRKFGKFTQPLMILLMRWSLAAVTMSGVNVLTIACYEYTLREGEKHCQQQKIAATAKKK